MKLCDTCFHSDVCIKREAYPDNRDCCPDYYDEKDIRPTGKWISISEYHHSYKCSECGRTLIHIESGKNKVAIDYPYCPYCGAKMKGRKKNG